ncbi:cysteinyl leukotriene receptor 1-like [Scleropages formosus]|uniref:Cysteinyl leukotriene receptor 1 n=1 Tax=Scleropages formosus TaxID=113540 RepID=A0A0N8K066_SCLFO|nr:cysteinyl leukotriene receptor 1-like [Scleropages formosus]XP_018583983.1 cysteinyl leukotriene receptor 1-like [Scleropages formosus]XP_018583984.1 cysteinyl leukotriene receptor 1-like [Scleropages formosus]KPP71281.1 cysteinyl leukotriene receptor 1-like [Scleropages formosus]
MALLNISSNISEDSPTDAMCPNIDEFRNRVYSTVYSIVTIVGLIGNGFALIVLIRSSHQRSAFHVYMLNLAMSDLLCVSTLPLRVRYYVNNAQWDYGDFLCRISSYALYVNLYCSIYFMMALSFTRFLAIVFPIQNMKLVSTRKACIVCLCIWIFICTSSSPFLMTGVHEDPISNKTKCFEPPGQRKDIHKLIILNYISLVVGFSVPFLVILICSAGIIYTLLTGPSSIRQKRNSRIKAIRMIVIIMLAFLISFMPYHIQRTIHLHFMNRTDVSCKDVVFMHKSVVITLCLAAANSCFDPMLYFFSGENFRRRLSTLRHNSIIVRGSLRRQNSHVNGSQNQRQDIS